MRIGDEVSYIDDGNGRHTAVITRIAGSGRSDRKTLDLEYRTGGENVRLEAVPHEDDAEQGQGFWIIKGTKRSRTPDDEPAPVEATVDTVAFPEVPDTAPPSETRTPRR